MTQAERLQAFRDLKDCLLIACCVMDSRGALAVPGQTKSATPGCGKCLAVMHEKVDQKGLKDVSVRASQALVEMTKELNTKPASPSDPPPRRPPGESPWPGPEGSTPCPPKATGRAPAYPNAGPGSVMPGNRYAGPDWDKRPGRKGGKP